MGMDYGADKDACLQIYTYIYIHIYVYIYISIYIYTYVYAYICIYIYTYTCMTMGNVSMHIGVRKNHDLIGVREGKEPQFRQPPVWASPEMMLPSAFYCKRRHSLLQGLPSKRLGHIW